MKNNYYPPSPNDGGHGCIVILLTLALVFIGIAYAIFKA